MDGIELLRAFAESQSIDSKEVDKFLAQWEEPTTLEDLLNTPYDALNHISYITYLDEPLHTFITDDMWCEKYETVSLERVAEFLKECIKEAIDENNEERLEELREVEKNIIETKFGSVEYDW